MNSIKFGIVLGLYLCAGTCLAQAPLPGAPTPGAEAGIGAPAPGRPPAQLPVGTPAANIPVNGGTSPIPGSQAPVNFRRLPINYQGAAVRLEELRNLMPNIKAKDFQEMINEYLEWVGDLADGHWRIHQSFAKVDTMKDRAETEKQTTLKFGQLKRQAMLLKAEFLIKENRHPEALQPLVEIVVAEPKTQTGDSAYSLLKQIGFAEEAVPMPVGIAPQAAPLPTEPASAKPAWRPAGKTAAR